MRLLLVVPSLKQGGAERVVATLSRRFAAEHQTHILVFNSADVAYEFGGTLVDLGLKAGSRGGKLVNGVRRVWAIRRHMQSFRPHLAVSFTESANLPTAVAAALAGERKRSYVSIRSNPGKFSWHVRWLGALLYRFPAGIVACSEGVAAAVPRVYGLDRERVSTIVNPVEVPACDSSSQADPLPPSATERPYFVTVGRIGREKGYDVLLVAWARSGLASTHNLLVLGNGPLKDELRQMATSLGLDGSVHFLGGVANPFPIVRRAVAFVLSSRFEGWPNALAEAMALGVPVISTDCPFGPSELIRNEEEGILVPVENSEALGRAIRELSQDEPRRRRLGAAAKARTAELSPQRIADQWLALASEGNRHNLLHGLRNDHRGDGARPVPRGFQIGG